MPTWKTMISRLDTADYKVLRQSDPDAKLIGEIPYLPDEEEAEEFLYSYDISELPEDGDFSRYSFLLYESAGHEAEHDIRKVGSRFKNCIYIPEPYKKKKVSIAIHKYFTVFHLMNETLVKMQQMVKNDQGLQKLVDLVAETLETSVDILDPSLKFLVTSDYPDDRLPMHQKFARPGEFLPAHFLKEFKQKGELEKLITTTREIQMHHPKYTSWFVPVTIHGTNVGYLVAFEKPEAAEQKVRDWYLPYLPYFADIIAIEMGKEGIRSASKENYFNYILSGLLDGNRTSFDTLKSLLAVYGYDLQSNIFLVLVEKENSGKRDLLITADSLKNAFFNSIYTVKDDKICFFISRKKNQLFHEEYRTVCDQFFSSNNLYGVMAGPFQDPENICNYKDAAELVLSWKSRKKEYGFYDFAEYQLDAMLEKVSQSLPLYSFCYHPVLKLLNYDKKHGTALLETLEIYINGDKKIGDICRKLCISKAALYKRLDRIRDIMGCDFTSAQIQVKIQVSMHILRMLKPD